VTLCPADLSVPTNHVIITGNGTINSFGPSQAWTDSIQDPNEEDPDNPVLPNVPVPAVTGITKTITFQPDSGQTITVKHTSPTLVLLGNRDRVISKQAIGTYSVDRNNNWTEQYYAEQPTPPYQSINSGVMLSRNYYTTSQTITIPAAATRAQVQMWGAAQGSYAAGGGAPGYLEKLLTGLTPGNTLIFTRGNGTPNYITSATVTTLASGTQTIGTLTCNPGLTGGFGAGGGPGGTATGGDINMNGGKGSSATPQDYSNPGGAYNSGAGASNMFAKGADGDAAGANGGLIITWYSTPIA